MWDKFPAKWGVQIVGMNFQTRSNSCCWDPARHEGHPQ
nr:DUF6783 domain-containing protein [uncultured Eisenbergiella sp.]